MGYGTAKPKWLQFHLNFSSKLNGAKLCKTDLQTESRDERNVNRVLSDLIPYAILFSFLVHLHLSNTNLKFQGFQRFEINSTWTKLVIDLTAKFARMYNWAALLDESAKKSIKKLSFWECCDFFQNDSTETKIGLFWNCRAFSLTV